MFFGQVEIWVGALDGDTEESMGGRKEGALGKGNEVGS